MELSAAFIKRGFDERGEQLFFQVDETEYVIQAEYDEYPIINCVLCYNEPEDDEWFVLSDDGEAYSHPTQPPEMWRGLPEYLAERILSAVNMHNIGV